MTSIYAMYYCFDMPVEYKGLVIYPVKVKDIFKFNFFAQILLLEKEAISENISFMKQILSMSELEYVYYLAATNNEIPYLQMLHELLKLVLRKDIPINGTYITNDKANGIICLDGKEYTSRDFLEIKKIICEANDLELPDKNIDPDLRRDLKEAENFRRNANSSFKMGGLEDQMICVSISTEYKLEEIYEMTIRKFNKMLLRIDHKLHYEIYKTASMSGFVEFKDKSALKHWMADLKIGMEESGVLINAESFTKKLEHGGIT